MTMKTRNALISLLFATVGTIFLTGQHSKNGFLFFDKESLRRALLGNDMLRLAVFGSSSAWGAGLASRFTAYPFLLSDLVTNYASYAGGANYPAVCTESIVGEDKIFDVIVLDYFYTSRQGLAPLVSKLRHRFPNALIMFVKVWYPYQARRILPDGSQERLLDFQTGLFGTNGVFDNMTNLIEALEADTADWIFIDRTVEHDLINQTASAYDVVLYELDGFEEDAKQALIKHLNLFDNSATHGHLSELGHEVLAKGIDALIRSEVPTPTVKLTEATLGTWGKGDSCHFWFTTGACPFEFSSGFVLEQYDEFLGFFALEISSEGVINITNPFEDSRHLYLSFMTLNQAGVFPQVALVNLNNTVLDPLTTQNTGGIMVPRTISVGLLPPGLTEIQIKPLEVAKYPFRLVGASFTDEVVVPDEFAFAPPYDQNPSSRTATA
jgi:hypothetical protein